MKESTKYKNLICLSEISILHLSSHEHELMLYDRLFFNNIILMTISTWSNDLHFKADFDTYCMNFIFIIVFCSRSY